MKKNNADCVIALSFGLASTKSKVNLNKELAEAASLYGLPIIAQAEIANYCKQTGAVISKRDGYLDSWAMISQAKSVMKKNNYQKAILVAHKAHISRARRQAIKLQVACVIPHSLPSKWDKYSQQWWTRSGWLWRIHEFIAVPYLKLLHRI